MAGMSGPPLTERTQTGDHWLKRPGRLSQAQPLPQALIQCRQRLTYELRLGKLVILSWSAPQPVADDSAVA